MSISASAGEGGTINPSGTVPVTCGNDQSFTITADTCYNISDIIIDGVSSGPTGTISNITTFTNIITNHIIRAEFQFLQFPITATAGDGGNITPVGITFVPCGESQSYTITANPCYQIKNVMVDGVSLGSQASPFPYTFTNVQEVHTISATFEKLGPFTITSSALYMKAGSYSTYPVSGVISPEGVTTVECGSSLQYTMQDPITIEGETYELANVIIDGERVGRINPYTFENVQQDHTIVALYAPHCYFLAGFVRDSVTGAPLNHIRVELYRVKPNYQFLWYTYTNQDGGYYIPNMVTSANNRFDASIENNPYSWINPWSRLYGESPSEYANGSRRYDFKFTPGEGWCKRYLDWYVRY